MEAMTLQEVQKKARFGHRDWVFFRNAEGASHAARFARDSIKAALLATGCSGHFYVAAASTGVLERHGWRSGCLMFRNVRHLLAA